MIKRYVKNLRPVQEGDNWREDVYFVSQPEGAMYWLDAEGAEVKCQELNRGTRIQSSLGSAYFLTDFKVEKVGWDEYSIYCEDPFLVH
jgi:hypothetical protein